MVSTTTVYCCACTPLTSTGSPTFSTDANAPSKPSRLFVKVDPADPSNPLAGQFDGLESQLDPTKSLEGFEGAFTSVEKVGAPVDVDGVQAQQYTVVVDTTKISGPLADQAAATGSALPPELTYDYWIDAQDRMVRTTSTVSGATVDMTFSGWGEDFGITAPGDDEISTEPLF